MSINPATAKNGNSNTTETFLSSVVTNVGLLVLQVGVFVYLKSKLGQVYTPKSYLPTDPKKRAEPLPRGPWKWIPAVLLQDPLDIIKKNGLDAYMFIRFLRLVIIIFLFLTVITYPILLPLDAVKMPNSTRTGLDRFEWGNVASDQNPRYAAHIIIAYLSTFFIIWLVRHELVNYVHCRDRFLIGSGHAPRARARTVLITSLPPALTREPELRDFTSFVPGGVNRVWIYRDTKALNKLFGARASACQKLEAALSSLLRTATKNSDAQTKRTRAPENVHDRDGTLVGQQAKEQTGDYDPEAGPPPEDDETPAPATWEMLDALVPEKQRPKHHLGPLGVVGVGKKVDTYAWAKAEIARLNQEIADARGKLTDLRPCGSAFVECNLQMGAHVLAQCVSYHEPLIMADKWIEVSPKDVIWSNLDDPAFEMRTRYATSWIATIALIIGWAFPVTFIGLLSNVASLCQKAHWLNWICKAPSPVPGIIQGVLPPVLLALLMIFLPILLRALAWWENIPLYSLLELSVYKRYYAFLVLNGFLIVTLSSGVTAAISEIIANPASAVEDLASQLPNSSIFFLTYMISQGLAGAASALIQLGRLIFYYIQKSFLGRTPRQAYQIKYLMPSISFGVTLPRISLLVTIGLAYSVISPIINGLAVVSFAALYLAWKFLLTQVYDQPEESETGGLYFPLAISNLFVGLYIEQICLLCLFALQIPSTPISGVVEVVFMLLLLVITFASHIFLYSVFKPIEKYLPMSLATQQEVKRFKRSLTEPKVITATGALGQAQRAQEDVVDLFSRERVSAVLNKTLKLDPRQLKGSKRPQAELSIQGNNQAPVETTTALSLQTTQPVGLEQQAKDDTGANPPAPAPPLPAELLMGEDEEEIREELEDHAFDHPSVYVEQVWVWMPRDRLGISRLLVDDLKNAGVEASDEGARMDGKGEVEAQRCPPDEEWQDVHNL